MEETTEQSFEQASEPNEQSPEAPTTFPCRWPDCSVAEFATELDMGLHVLATHLVVLRHGHFTLTRGLNGPAAPDAPAAPAAPSDAPNDPVSPYARKRRREDEDHLNTSYPVGEDVKMSDVAVNLIRRLNTPSRELRLFQSEHFCVICQRNWQSPCRVRHDPAEVAMVNDWKRTYGHLEPKKKAMLSQMRQIRDRYLRDEKAPRALIKKEPEPVAEEVPEVVDAPEDSQATEEHHQEEHELTSGNESSRSLRTASKKMSTICASLIFRLRNRCAAFRCNGNNEFCLPCLSYTECHNEHTHQERRLEKTWKKYFGEEKVTVETLIVQLEKIRGRYLERED